MAFNKELSATMEKGRRARAAAVDRMRSVMQDHSYTNEYRQAEGRRIIQEAREAIAAAKAEGMEASSLEIRSLDNEELEEAHARSLDGDYLQRLNTKIETAKTIARREIDPKSGSVSVSIPADSVEGLKVLFSEFENDPVSRRAILAAFPGTAVLAIVPEDNTGKRQAHIRAVIKVYELLMDRMAATIAGSVDVLQEGHGEWERQELDAFIAYCDNQDAELSKDDEAMLEAVKAADPSLRIACDSILIRIRAAESRA